eukprot:TRINITY_DN6005_c0_g1_i2.p1 TRINITY_DN6005_c0_g1~~TRINITY_DN6005_c0_g1_i2.p1  ORF type:complete len:611 (+),score=155.64 TRINITY_DN6005_c0_g1_i2:71-1834(+)
MEGASQECPVCRTEYQPVETVPSAAPRLLHCGHSVCSLCSKRMLDLSVDKTHLDCPCCRAKTVLAKDSNVLSLNYALMDVIRSSRAAAVDPATICEECDEKLINVFCEICQISVCKVCLGKIHAPKSLQKHAEHVLPASRNRKFGMEKCKAHGEPLKLFCVDEKVFLCLLCRDYTDEHKGHQIDLASSELEKSKRAISQQMVNLCALAARFKEIDASLEHACDSLDQNSQAALEHVTKEVDKAIRVLQNKFHRMSEAIQDVKSRKLSKLMRHRHKLNLLLRKLEIASEGTLVDLEGAAVCEAMQSLKTLIEECQEFEKEKFAPDIDIPVYFEDLSERIDAYCLVGEPDSPSIYQSSSFVDAGTFFLSWTQVESAGNYVVEMCNGDFGGENVWEEIYKGSETSTKLALYPNSAYKFRVSAMSLAGFRSDPSNILELKTRRSPLEWDLGFVCPGYSQQYTFFQKCRATKSHADGMMTIMRTRECLPNEEFILWKLNCQKITGTGEFHIGVVPYDWNWSSCWLKGRGYEFDVVESGVLYCCFNTLSGSLQITRSDDPKFLVTRQLLVSDLKKPLYLATAIRSCGNYVEIL